jgi:hypothetical protein
MVDAVPIMVWLKKKNGKITFLFEGVAASGPDEHHHMLIDSEQLPEIVEYLIDMTGEEDE